MRQNELGCVGVNKKRTAPGSLIKDLEQRCHLRPGVSIICPGTEPLMEDKSPLFLPGAGLIRFSSSNAVSRASFLCPQTYE